MFSIVHELLNVKIYTTDGFHEFYMIDMILCYVFNYYKRCLIYAPRLLGYELFLSFSFSIRLVSSLSFRVLMLVCLILIG